MTIVIEETENYKLIKKRVKSGGCQCYGDCDCYKNTRYIEYYLVKSKRRGKTKDYKTLEEAKKRIEFLNQLNKEQL